MARESSSRTLWCLMFSILLYRGHFVCLSLCDCHWLINDIYTLYLARYITNVSLFILIFWSCSRMIGVYSQPPNTKYLSTLSCHQHQVLFILIIYGLVVWIAIKASCRVGDEVKLLWWSWVLVLRSLCCDDLEDAVQQLNWHVGSNKADASNSTWLLWYHLINTAMSIIF